MKNLKENKELIANFMELAKQDRTNDGGGIFLYESPENGEYVEPIELLYEQSWDLLIPVIKKINSLGISYDSPEYKIIEAIEQYLLAFDIEGTCLNVIDFIKFYNNIKKQKL